MPVTGEASSVASTAAEQGRLRRTKAQLGHPIQEISDPNPPARPNMPTISSLLLNPSEPSPAPTTKKNHFSPAKFRGLGCTAAASQQVSVPAAIRTSADWERRKANKKQKKGFLKKSRAKNQGLVSDGSNFGCNSSASCVVAEDAWCGPGIGFSAADAECVVAVGRRNTATEVPPRGKIDADRLGQREVNSSLHSLVNHWSFVLYDVIWCFLGIEELLFFFWSYFNCKFLWFLILLSLVGY